MSLDQRNETRSDALRRAYTSAAQLGAFLLQSLGRKPGEAMDDTDMRLYQRELFPVLDAVRTGKLRAAFEPTSDGADALQPGSSPALWELVYFIRNAEFRPNFEAVGRKVREVLGLPIEAVPGGEATARRVITTPLRLPWGPAPTAPPLDPEAPWVQRFARELARGDDAFDTALLTLLARLPTDLARERAMTELILARDSATALRAARAEGAERGHIGQRAEKTHLQEVLKSISTHRKETTAPS